MTKKILITGATGLIGTELVNLCLSQNISVNFLTTSKDKIQKDPNLKGFYWNPEDGEIDIEAFEGVTAIINLAGATISKRWTSKYKETIIDSRVKSMELIYNTLQNMDHNIGQFISASGINIYPDSEVKLYTEEEKELADNFLGTVIKAWEGAAARFKDLGMDVAKIRTGMVLAKNGGALPQLVTPVKFGVGAPLGSGNQWQSWIHLRDIAGIYLFVLQNHLEGIYNAVTPNPVQNKKMTRLIASILKKPLWLPNVPAFALKLILGEMATLALESQIVSPRKIQKQGFHFEFQNIENALQDLLRKT